MYVLYINKYTYVYISKQTHRDSYTYTHIVTE